MSKIIFLDIDGPMIPLRAFMFNRSASIDQALDEACLKVLRHIVDQTDAQIVLNTTHNYHLSPHSNGPGLLARFNDAGFEVGREIHSDHHTLYPHVDRLTAIRNWLSRNPTETWCAFDDCQIDDDRAFLTDADHGIGWHEFQHARQHLLGEKPHLVLL